MRKCLIACRGGQIPCPIFSIDSHGASGQRYFHAKAAYLGEFRAPSLGPPISRRAHGGAARFR
jgi:hypothetical protein